LRRALSVVSGVQERPRARRDLVVEMDDEGGGLAYPIRFTDPLG